MVSGSAAGAIGRSLTQGGGRGFTWAISTNAQSISQWLNAGKYIIPATTATGAAVGSAGGGVGAIPGAVSGFGYGTAMAGFMVEFNSSIVQAVQESGYDATDPKELEAALQDPEVFKRGATIGLARGIPIAIVDKFTAGIAGNLFSKGALSPLGARLLGVAAESVFVDMPSEFLGEAAAQLSANVFAGVAMDPYEMLMEPVGGMYQTAGTNASAKLLGDVYKKNSGYYIEAGESIDGILGIDDTPQALSRFVETQVSRGNISESKGADRDWETSPNSFALAFVPAV